MPTQNSDMTLNHSVACRYWLVRVIKKSSVKCFPHLQQDIKVEGLQDFPHSFCSFLSLAERKMNGLVSISIFLEFISLKVPDF